VTFLIRPGPPLGSPPSLLNLSLVVSASSKGTAFIESRAFLFFRWGSLFSSRIPFATHQFVMPSVRSKISQLSFSPPPLLARRPDARAAVPFSDRPFSPFPLWVFLISSRIDISPSFSLCRSTQKGAFQFAGVSFLLQTGSFPPPGMLSAFPSREPR